MAKDMEDAEFLLPSEFLCDDFFLEGVGTRKAEEEVAATCFSMDVCPASDSNPSSPVDSATTKSDEEDYMAWLTQKMAHSFLQDDDANDTPVLAGDSAKVSIFQRLSSLLLYISCLGFSHQVLVEINPIN